MNLQSLTENQRYRLVSLPYRAGLYVSESDQSGGEAANENERRALENLIYGFADGMFGSEFVQHVMAETINCKDQWAQWGSALEKVPDECSDALSILSGAIDHKERSAYAARIMDIGEAVALAFRESHEVNSVVVARFKDYLRYLKMVRKAKSKKLPVRGFEDFLSISSDERKALNRLAAALGREYI